MFFDRVNRSAPFRVFSLQETLHFCDPQYIEAAEETALSLLRRLYDLRYINYRVSVFPSFSEKVYYVGNETRDGFKPFYKVIFTGKTFNVYSVDLRSPDFLEKELIAAGISLETTKRSFYRRYRTLHTKKSFSCSVCSADIFEEIIYSNRVPLEDLMPAKKFSFEYFSLNDYDF